MNAVVFGLYVLLLLLGIVLLCAEGLFRFSLKLNYGLSRRNCRVLVVALAALQLALSVAWPVASSIADWGVSTHAHSIVGLFLLNLFREHGVGIAIGTGGLLGIGAVMSKLDEFRRRRPAPINREDDEVIYDGR